MLYNQIYAVKLFYTVMESHMQLHISLYKTMRNITDTHDCFRIMYWCHITIG